MKKPFKKDYSRDRKPAFRGAPKPVSATLKGDLPREATKLPSPDHDLVYGMHSVSASLANPKRKFVRLWATENGLARLKENGELPQVTVDMVHPRVIDHILTGQDAVHQGVLLEAKPLQQPRLDQVPREGLVVVLDQVTDPHNVGAILRTCAAFDVKALVVTARHAPHESGVLFKSASGAYEHVPMCRVTNLASALEELRGYGFQLIGLDSEATREMESAADERPSALVLGAEGKGLREKTRATCDVMARIAMPGEIKSLNVSIAAALSLYILSK